MARGPVPATVLKKQLQKLIESQPAAKVDYVEFFEPATLQSVETVGLGTHLALAVLIGKTRLIDNGSM